MNLRIQVAPPSVLKLLFLETQLYYQFKLLRNLTPLQLERSRAFWSISRFGLILYVQISMRTVLSD